MNWMGLLVSKLYAKLLYVVLVTCGDLEYWLSVKEMDVQIFTNTGNYLNNTQFFEL